MTVTLPCPRAFLWVQGHSLGREPCLSFNRSVSWVETEYHPHLHVFHPPGLPAAGARARVPPVFETASRGSFWQSPHMRGRGL